MGDKELRERFEKILFLKGFKVPQNYAIEPIGRGKFRIEVKDDG